MNDRIKLDEDGAYWPDWLCIICPIFMLYNIVVWLGYRVSTFIVNISRGGDE